MPTTSPDWRSFVRAVLERRGWTQRDLAARVHMSEANLSMKLQRGRRLSPNWTARFVEAMGLDRDQADWFSALVDRESGSERASEAAELYLRTRLAERTPHPDQAAVAAQADWRVNVIQELATCEGFRPQPEWLAETTDPPMDPPDAAEVWATLVRAGLVRPRDGGGFDVLSVRTDPVLVPSQTFAGQRLQSSVFDLVRRGWGQFHDNERHGGVTTMAVSEATATRILRRLRELEQELVQMAIEDPEPRNRVYFLTTQWLPASRYTDSVTGSTPPPTEPRSR